MSKSVNVDFVTRQIEVDTDGKEHFISAAMAAKDAEQSMLSAQNAAKEAGTIKDRVEYLVNGNFPYVTPEMFGAVGDGVADDTDAVQKALDYCKSNSINLIGNKIYYITKTLNINSLGRVSIDINQLNSPDGVTALQLERCYQTIVRVKMVGTHANGDYDYSDFDNHYAKASVCGLIMKNSSCFINAYAQNYHIGVQFLGDAGGAVTNDAWVETKDCVISVDLNSKNSGWVNQNYISVQTGNFSSNAHKEDNVSVRIWSEDKTYLKNNNNIFDNCCFENIGYAVFMLDGRYNRFINMRLESQFVKEWVVYGENAVNNLFDYCFNGGKDVNDEIAKNSLNMFYNTNLKKTGLYEKIVEWRYNPKDFIIKRGAVGRDWGTIYCKDMDIIKNTITDTLTLNSIEPASDVIKISEGNILEQGLGVYNRFILGSFIKLNGCKNYIAQACNLSENEDLRLIFICLDDDFNVLSDNIEIISDAGQHFTMYPNGVFRAGANINLYPANFEIKGDAVKYIFIGAGGAGYVSQLYKLDIYAKNMMQKPLVIKKQRSINEIPISTSDLLVGAFKVGQYVPNADTTSKSDSKGTYITKGYLCTAVAENGTATWVEDKLYL